ncbi:MAG: DUF2478 domain-containing protein [Pararhodobacter sp.]|nr:DUF2478 domain-containing protein [Pararhodobacter sp.]
MDLGYVTLQGRGATDACLMLAVAQLRKAGLAMAGTVQTNPGRAGRDACDMDLHVLPDGPVLRISQDLGSGARGCRLDGDALETAVAACLQRLDGAALVVINKFGKQEAGGRGLVPVIAAALERGLPVLVGVNALNLPSFLSFADGLAQPLPTDPVAIARWALAAAQTRAIAAE